MPETTTQPIRDDLVLALAEIEQAEESLRSARALIRELFGDALVTGEADDD